MKIMKKFKEILYGVRAEGEKLTPQRPFKIRPLDQKDFEKWCKELRVTYMHGKKPIHFNH